MPAFHLAGLAQDLRAFVLGDPATATVLFFLMCFAGWLLYMGHKDRKEAERKRKAKALVRAANAQYIADARRRAQQHPNVDRQVH